MLKVIFEHTNKHLVLHNLNFIMKLLLNVKLYVKCVSFSWVEHQIVGINVLINMLEDCIIPYLGNLGFN